MILQKYLLRAILFLGITMRIVYFFLTPPGQLPDEKFIYKRILTNTIEPSNTLFPEKAEFYYANNEYYYPPLYYLLSAKVLSIFNSNPPTSGNIEVHFPQNIFVLRLFSLLLSIVSLFIIWKIIERITSSNSIKLSAFSIAALLPSMANFSIAANQNNQVFFLTTLFIYLAITNLNNNTISNKASFLMGAVFGLSLLTKFDSVICIPFILLFVLNVRSKKDRVKNLYTFFLAAFLFGGWWYIINLIKYGWFYNQAIFSAAIQNYTKPFQTQNYLLSLILDTSVTFFSISGVVNNIVPSFPLKYLLALIIDITVVFLIKGVIFRTKLPLKSINYKYYMVLFYAFIINLAIFLLINLIVVFQPQGRYFFNSIIFISVTTCVVLISLISEKYSKILPPFLFIIFLILNIFSIGCSLQYFHNKKLFPDNIKCGGNYIPVGEIKSDLP